MTLFNPSIATRRSSGLAYPYYVVSVLMLAYAFSLLDRMLISLLIGPIRAEFGLGDSQVGVLVGFAFALFYAVVGVPFGMLADATNRRNLVLVGLVGWSLATAGSGLVQGFGGLLLMRMLVGVGEAALTPAALSTIADRFPPAKVGSAVAIYSIGASIGAGLALVFGGMVSDWAQTTSLALPGVGPISGWRLTFLVVGLTGLPLAAIIALTMREAPRINSQAPPPFGDFLRVVRSHIVAFAGAFGGIGFFAMGTYATALWTPVFLIRVHGMSLSDTGLALGLMMGIITTAGVLTGGVLTDRLLRRGLIDAPLKVMAMAQIILLPLVIIAFLAPDRGTSLTALALQSFFSGSVGGLQGAVIVVMMPPLMRGRAMAVNLVVQSLIGMGIGPLMVGLLSDFVFHDLGWAIVATVTLGVVGGVVTLRLARPRISRLIAESASG